jgi:hypothetical protein
MKLIFSYSNMTNLQDEEICFHVLLLNFHHLVPKNESTVYGASISGKFGT